MVDQLIVAASYLPDASAVLDSSGWVTMLMLVMPARLTASMTEAKASKGTLLVRADVDGAIGGIALAVVAQGRGQIVEIDGRVVSVVAIARLQEDVLILVDGDDGALLRELVTERVWGTWTSIPDCSTGAVSMKMMSSTSTTSTSGVMLISASAVWVRIWPPVRMERGHR